MGWTVAFRRHIPSPAPPGIVVCVLEALGDVRGCVWFVQVGANDADHGDSLNRFIRSRGWQGAMVEPVPYVFRRLVKRFGGRPGIRLVNAAVAARAEERDFFHLAESGDQLPRWYDQIGSFQRDHLLQHREQIPDIETRIRRVRVPCLTLAGVLRQACLARYDLLYVDAEGCDDEIVGQVDLGPTRPGVIVYEHRHLPTERRTSCASRLGAAGYVLFEAGCDTVAVDGRDAPLLSAAERRIAASAERPAAGATDAGAAACLSVGVTSWNSATFLPVCLQSVLATAGGALERLVVLDNCSTDGSAEAARAAGAEVISRRCSQPEALRHLLDRSRSRYTLLIHSDVVLLSPIWFGRCRSRLEGNVVLVSPEDVGCGPLSRPFGKGMPESSFMLFDTEKAKRARSRFWQRRWRIPVPFLALDFSGEHITHNLPRQLAANGLAWHPMRVHVSPRTAGPGCRPAFTPGVWSDELSFLRYGLGNFYSIDGEITHYHNWCDRIEGNEARRGARPTLAGDQGFPLEYIRLTSRQFLSDYAGGCLRIPEPQTDPPREPCRL